MCKEDRVRNSSFLKCVLVTLVVLVLGSCNREIHVGPQSSQAGLRTTFFDVGQADAALLKTPEATVVIDTGHNGQTAQLLRQEGVTHIDLLILSHAHADHIGGLAAIAKRFPIAELWYAGRYRGRAGAIVRTIPGAVPVTAGKVKTLGRLTLEVLHPEAEDGPERNAPTDVNDGSVVVKAIYGESRFLYPGDCELGCWEQVFRAHRSELRADVLKAAHHGSSNGTSSGVLINVRPQEVIISCGRNNEYGGRVKSRV